MSKRKTVLIVEDSEDLRRLYALALGIAGYRTLEARDGLEALMLLDVDRPNLVLLDLNLPKINGHVVREELAAGDLTRDIPIVVVTGSSVDEDELAVPCLLRKPVTPDRIVAAVRTYLPAGPRSAEL